MVDIISGFIDFVFDRDGFKGIPGQHLLDVLILGLDLPRLQGFGVPRAISHLVVLLLDLPADPDYAGEEDGHDEDVLVLAILHLFDELFSSALVVLVEFLLPWLEPSLQEIGLWLAAVEDLQGLFLFLLGRLLLKLFKV